MLLGKNSEVYGNGNLIRVDSACVKSCVKMGARNFMDQRQLARIAKYAVKISNDCYFLDILK